MAPVADEDVRAHKGIEMVVPFASFPVLTSVKDLMVTDTQTLQL